jgi:hypothetical protein
VGTTDGDGSESDSAVVRDALGVDEVGPVEPPEFSPPLGLRVGLGVLGEASAGVLGSGFVEVGGRVVGALSTGGATGSAVVGRDSGSRVVAGGAVVGRVVGRSVPGRSAPCPSLLPEVSGSPA